MIIKIICIGILLVAFNLLVQGIGTVYWIRRIGPVFKENRVFTNARILKIVLFTILLFTILHTAQSLVWAIGYTAIPETASQFASFSEAFYFSMVTFTTLGYGDISLSSDWRLLSGFEAINGIMLIGWSTAMMFALIQNIYKRINAI